MKRLNFILSFVLAVTLLFGALPAIPVQAASETMYTISVPFPAYLAENSIEEAFDQTVIDEMLEAVRTAVMSCQSNISISKYNIPFSDENLGALGELIKFSIPEAFHLSNSIVGTGSGGRFTLLQFKYTMTANEFAEAWQVCEAAADKLLRGIKDNTSFSEVEKALLLHDRLALHCEYDKTYSKYTMYDALVGQKAVCEGYAMAYMYLLDRVGIKSKITDSETLNHAWNIVYIDDTPYHVDVTWDDPTEDIYGRVYHNNFLVSTACLKTGEDAHNANDFNIAPADTRYDNSYWRNSETAFQCIGGKIYYIDNVNGLLCSTDGNKKICDVNGTWYISDDGYYITGNNARLACENDILYCSIGNTIYQVNLTSNSLEEFNKPNLTVNGRKHYSIFGFKYTDGIAYLNLAYLSNGMIASTRTTVQLGCTHTEVTLLPAVSATCTQTGLSEGKTCKSCGYIIAKQAVIPATGHTWTAATCTLPKTCTVCHTTNGAALGHTWTDATCTEPKTCSVCHITEGEARGHAWIEATCTAPKTCSVCHATDGSALGHKDENADKLCDFCSAHMAANDSNYIFGKNENGNYIVFNIPCHTTIEQFIAELGYDDVNVYDKDGKQLSETAPLTTGCTVNLFDEEGNPIGAYTVVVAGDIDEDGLITAADARLALRAAVGLEILTSIQLQAADIEPKDELTAGDARILLRISVGLEHAEAYLQ